LPSVEEVVNAMRLMVAIVILVGAIKEIECLAIYELQTSLNRAKKTNKKGKESQRK
jgi:hypothetical protein